MPFRVRFRTRRVERELRSLVPNDTRRIAAAIDALIVNPRPVGSIRLRGSPGMYRIRVGEFRVIYSIDYSNSVVIVQAVLRRNERTYR
jgi:mRNA interferase RelE/StbE